MKTYSTWKKAAVLHLRDKSKPYFAGRPVAILAEYIVRKPKTTKREWPRGDVDNYDKAIFDALTACKSVWVDDDQILMSVSIKRFAEPGEDEHTKATIIQL